MLQQAEGLLCPLKVETKLQKREEAMTTFPNKKGNQTINTVTFYFTKEAPYVD